MAAGTSYAPGAPSWIDLVTTDPEGAMAFYGALLGWEFDVGGPETGFYTYCICDGLRAAGMVGRPVETMPTAWTIYLASHDVDETGRLMAEAGGTLILGPADAGPAGRVVVGADPTGAVVGAWQGADHAGAEITDAAGAVVWTELVTTDLPGARAFYTRVFGHEWQETEPADPPYLTFAVAGALAGGATSPGDDWDAGGTARWVSYLGVDDLDAAAALAQQLGGGVVGSPHASQWGRWVRLRDPQGGMFAALELPG